MVKKIALNASARDKKSKAGQVRKEGYIPAILYGPDTESKQLKIKKNEFEKAYNRAGESALIDLYIDKNDSDKVIIKEVQEDPIKGKLLHVDFYKVDMRQKLDVEIPLNFTGEPKVLKEEGGTLVKSIEELEVRCLPGDLVDKIDVDLSGLDTYEDVIRIKDLNIPEGLEVIPEPEDTVAHVMEPVEEEEEAPVEEEAVPGEEAEEEAVPGEEDGAAKPEDGGEGGRQTEAKQS